MLLLLSCFPSVASTYYLDFETGLDANDGLTQKTAWKHCPGMTKFRGTYHHHAGDRFIFKGGSVWPSSALPFVIAYDGQSGKKDTYTTDHAWFKGDRWSQPLFTGEHSRVQLLKAEKRSWFTVDDLKFIDFGNAGQENGGKAVDIQACAHYTIKNCTFAPQSWIGLYLHSYSGSEEVDILIDSNDISGAGQAIVVAVEAPRTRMRRVTLSNNDIHDLASQLVGQTHGDGIHTWNSVQTDHSQYLSDLVIRGNKFFGDFSGNGKGAGMTSLIYLTDPGKRALISENVLTNSGSARFAALIWVRYFDSVWVVNNTLTMDSAQGNMGIIVGQGEAGKQVVVRNNIILGAKYCYYIYPDASPTLHIDNNTCVTTGPAMAFWNMAGKTWPEWQQLGNDIHGIRENSQLTSLPEDTE